MGVFIALALFLLALYLAYRWSIASYEYFKLRGVPFVKPLPLVGGMFPVLSGTVFIVDCISEGYRRFRASRFSGLFMFRQPAYLIHDPELIKKIAIADFEHFVDHSFKFSTKMDPFLGRSLFFMDGLRVGNDVMTSISFGIDVDSVKDPQNDFFQNGKSFTNTEGIQGFKFFLATMIPEYIFTFLRIRLTPAPVAQFYETIVTCSIKSREEKNVIRPDFIHLLMQARKNILQEDQSDRNLESAGFSTVPEHLQSSTSDLVEWSDLDITAAVASFFFGGIESTTTMLCFTVYEVSLLPEIQAKLHAEIDSVQNNLEDHKLTYESIQKMKYLDMVVSETLRLWPPIGLTNRKCTKDYIMKNNDGTQVTLTKGDIVQIPIQSIHRDSRFFPEPMRFDPERFSDENRHMLNQDAYMPFGLGPRNCVGSRLALMQAKCILYYLFLNFEVQISSRTDVPMQLDKRSMGVNAKNGFWFHLVPRREGV
ncbi:cytochrome P450 3A19 [Culex quinquefasciatus]|uniref:Cytochrome P450 3A19 n=1 Tax=Culex quinquefasciatus TaxID=7176 RepID=B0X3S8_CULQU|nr:cytochrome P450 3A19 [Culex quinquefasciatus]|eukprot:XP_001864300.1 cytochrome P450 3A19 [Culex quinquefasciatus]